MKKKWLIGGLVVVVAGAAGAVAWVLRGPSVVDGSSTMAANAAVPATPDKTGKDGKDKKPAPPLEFLPREVVQPSLARLPTRIEFSGPLVAPSTAVVRAKAGGTLLALNVAEGSRVKAGQALGRIDLAELGTRVAERNANVESARSALAQAERTHASNERLAAQQFISPVALDSSRNAVEAARAQLAAAQAVLDTVRVSVRDAALVAPISGIVAKRHAVEGERLQAEQPLLTLVDLARLELAGTVGTHEVSRLSPGLPVQVRVEGMDGDVTGRIARIAPMAEPGTRSIGVTIELANPREALRAGQYAVAVAVLEDTVDRLTVPASALGSTAGQDHVWVIESGVLARRAVLVGRRDERQGRVELLQGVQRDSQVLAARFDNLREGAKALVVAAKSGPGAAATASAALTSAAASAPVLR
jgi:membrane fusion protein, multidrug efflux system